MADHEYGAAPAGREKVLLRAPFRHSRDLQAGIHPPCSRCPRAAWLAIAALTLLTGCFRFGQPAPEIRSYRLDYPSPEVSGTALPVILRVPALTVAAVYDRESIVYRQDDYSTAADFYDRWSANPGAMLADLLARDLDASGLYRAVQHSPSMVPSDYQVTGEVEDIEERITGGACSAHLHLRTLVLRVRAGKGDPVVMRETYNADEPCPCNDILALANAMSKAMQSISAKMQQAVYDAIRADLR